MYLPLLDFTNIDKLKMKNVLFIRTYQSFGKKMIE